MTLTFTVTVCRIADDGTLPTNLEWHAAVTVHKKDGPFVVTGTGATPADAMRAAFMGARDADARAAVDEMRAALR